MSWVSGAVSFSLLLFLGTAVYGQNPTPVDPPQETERSVIEHPAPQQSAQSAPQQSEPPQSEVAPGPDENQVDGSSVVQPPDNPANETPSPRFQTYPMLARPIGGVADACPPPPQWIGACCLIHCAGMGHANLANYYSNAPPAPTGALPGQTTQVVRSTVAYGRPIRQSRLGGGAGTRYPQRGGIFRRFRR